MTETQTPEAGERVADYELEALIERARLDDKPLSLQALHELKFRRSMEVRAAALEEAARVADSLITNYERDGWGHAALEQAARHIRALSQSPPPTESK